MRRHNLRCEAETSTGRICTRRAEFRERHEHRDWAIVFCFCARHVRKPQVPSVCITSVTPIEWGYGTASEIGILARLEKA